MNDPKRILIVFLGLIVVILGVLGIKGVAEDAGYKNQVRYTTAIKAEDATRFNYAVDTQQGNLLVHGEFSTKPENLVKFDEMNQAFTYVERVKEHYTMHTREVCSSDADGNQHCHTEVYYTWDAVDWEERFAPKIELYGRTYDANLFNYGAFKNHISCEGFTKPNTESGWFFSDKNGCDGDEYYLDNDDRYVYSVAPQSFSATFLASSMGGGLNPVNESSISLKNKTIEQELHDVGMYKVWAFWVTLVVVILLICGGAYLAYYWVMEDGGWSLYD